MHSKCSYVETGVCKDTINELLEEFIEMGCAAVWCTDRLLQCDGEKLIRFWNDNLKFEDTFEKIVSCEHARNRLSGQLRKENRKYESTVSRYVLVNA